MKDKMFASKECAYNISNACAGITIKSPHTNLLFQKEENGLCTPEICPYFELFVKEGYNLVFNKKGKKKK